MKQAHFSEFRDMPVAITTLGAINIPIVSQRFLPRPLFSTIIKFLCTRDKRT